MISCRYLLPSTIWDGMPIKKGYRESSRDLMRKFYEKNNYPTLEERRLIAEQSGLNIGKGSFGKGSFLIQTLWSLLPVKWSDLEKLLQNK